MDSPIQIVTDNKVLRIGLNRPAVHNAFDETLIAELTQAFKSAAQSESIRVVVLQSEGPSFSAGADLNWMSGLVGASQQRNLDDAGKLAILMRTINKCPKPTIAKVQGSAFGGGVGLIACCDIAIAANTAKFALSEAKLGILPAVISPYVIEAIGARNARRYFASAQTFDAVEAHRIGLLHEIVEPGALEHAVENQVNAILAAGPMASSMAKNLIRNVSSMSTSADQDAYTAELIARLRVSDEGQEGLRAFLEKRKPAWTSN